MLQLFQFAYNSTYFYYLSMVNHSPHFVPVLPLEYILLNVAKVRYTKVVIS